MPRFLASSTCDLVDWIRNGLASFSDCAQPIVSVARLIFGMPRSAPLQIGPYWASTPAGTGAVSRVVPPAAEMALGTPPAAADEGAGAGTEAAAVVAAGAGALDAAGAADFLEEQPAAMTVRPTTARVVMRRGADIPCLPLDGGAELRARAYR